MTLWPFRRRQRSFEVGAGSRRLDHDDLASQRRTPISRKLSRRSHQPQGVRRLRRRRDRDSHFPISNLPPRISSSILDSIHGNHIIDLFDSDQYQARHNNVSSHSHTSTQPGSARRSIDLSPAFSQKKQRNVLRKLSNRSKRDSKIKTPSPYDSRLGRRTSIKSKYGRYLGECDRSLTPQSSVESDISRRAYKVRNRDMFSPSPTLKYEDASSLWSGKSRDTSRAYSRSQSKTPKGSLIPESRISDRNLKVDDLVDELDEAGLREAMERDRRNREKKRIQFEEHVRQRQERKAIRLQGQIYHQITQPGPSTVPTAVLQDPRTGTAISGTQTPVSCLNEDVSTSVEDINQSQQFVPRLDVITPVSMELPEDRIEEQEQKQPTVTEEVNQAPAEVAQSFAQVPPSPTEVIPSSVEAAPSPSELPPSPKSVHSPITARILDAVRSKKRQSIISVRSTGKIEKARSRWRSLFTRKKKNKARRDSKINPTTLLPYSQDSLPYQPEPSLDPNQLAHNITSFETQEPHFTNPDYNNPATSSPNLNPDDAFRDFSYTHSPVSSLSSLTNHYSGYSGLHGNDISTPLGVSTSSGSKKPDSPTIPAQHHYSPEDESGPALALAPIDSEGGWLSGRLLGKGKAEARAPLRAASVLKRRYTELAGVDDGSVGDRYFSGVTSPSSPTKVDDYGRIIDSAEEEEEEVDDEEILKEVEKDMWRDGVQKKVKLEKVGENRPKSTVGILEQFDPMEIDGNEGVIGVAQ